MLHCSIVRCNYKQTNRSEVTYFNLPKEPQKQKTWFAVISIDKDNLLSNVVCLFNDFEDKYFDKSKLIYKSDIFTKTGQ